MRAAVEEILQRAIVERFEIRPVKQPVQRLAVGHQGDDHVGPLAVERFVEEQHPWFVQQRRGDAGIIQAQVGQDVGHAAGQVAGQVDMAIENGTGGIGAESSQYLHDP